MKPLSFPSPESLRERSPYRFLSPDESSQIGQNARLFLEGLYRQDSSVRIPRFSASESLFTHLAVQQTDKEAASERKITPRLREIAEIFLRELIRLVQQKRRDHSPSSKQELKAFLMTVDDIFFSYSPNITEYVDRVSLIFVCSEATRIPEVQGWFGGSMIGELVYFLSYSDASYEEAIQERLGSCSTAEALDVLHTLEVIAADAVANGSWSRPAYEKIRSIVASLSDNTNNSFLRYATLCSYERILHEFTAPSLGVAKRRGDAGEGRLFDTLNPDEVEESRQWKQHIIADVQMRQSDHLMRLSRDAVAIYDHSTVPRYFAQLDENILQKPSDIAVPPMKIREISSRLSTTPAKFIAVLPRLVEDVVRPLVAPQDPFQYLQENIGVLDSDQWKGFVEVCKRLLKEEAILHERFATIKRETMERFDSSTTERFRFYTKLLDVILESIEPDGQAAQFLINSIEQFQTAVVENDLDSANDQLYVITTIFSTQKKVLECLGEFDEEISELLSAHASLNALYEKEWKSASLQQQELIREHNLLRAQITQPVDESAKALFSNIGDVVSSLSNEMKQFENTVRDSQPSTHFTDILDLSSLERMNPFPDQVTDDIPLLLQQLHRPSIRRMIESDLAIDLRSLSLASQIHLLRFLQDEDLESFQDIRSILQKSAVAQEVLSSFLACAEDTELGHSILRLSQYPEADELFKAYDSIIQNAEEQAHSLWQTYQQQHPSGTLKQHHFFQSLLRRSNEILESAERALEEDPQCIPRLVAELLHENDQVKACRSFVRNLTDHIAQGTHIQLSDLAEEQAFVLQTLEDAGAKGALLRSLQERGALHPIPEIHWRVDRTAEEYQRRFGFDVSAFLKENVHPTRQQLLLEFGPGNGTFMEQRKEAGANTGYLDLAVCDQVYFPMGPLIHRLIDFEKLEVEAGVELSEEDRSMIGEFLYKILVIEEGETSLDEFQYDTRVQEGIGKNVENIIQYLREKGPQLAITETIPQTISTRHTDPAKQGQVIYPYKFHKSEQSKAFQKACEVLGGSFESFLKRPDDLYDLVPAYTAGTIVSDFSAVDHLAPDQIDVALGVRSTVYLRGELYKDFMIAMSEKLSETGVYVDDNVRDNDGWYYRLRELLDVQKEIEPETTLFVITGPGFPGEDTNTDDDGVPLAVVMCKDIESANEIAYRLEPGFDIFSLQQLSKKTSYLKKLDQTGLVLNSVLRPQSTLTNKRKIA